MLDRKSNEPVKEQKQNICEECQLCIGLDDNEQRIANHSSGRLHNAILDMRRKIAELAASLEKSQVPGDWSRLEAAQQQSKQSTSRLDLASTRAHSYSPRSSRSSSSSSRSRSRSRRRSYSSDSCSGSSGECSSTSRSSSRSRSRSTSRHRSRRSRSESHRKSRSRSPRRRSSRSRSGSRYSRSCSRSCSRSYSRSCSRSRSCSCSSQYTDRSQDKPKHRSASRSRSRSRSRHSSGHSQHSEDRERRSRSTRNSDASKQTPKNPEEKEAFEPSQASEGEPEQPAVKGDSKWSRLQETEAGGTPTRKDSSPTPPGIKGRDSPEHTFTTADEGTTEVSKPMPSAQNSPKTNCSSALEVYGRTLKGGRHAIDANADVVDKPGSPASDPVFENLNLRPAQAECALEGEIRAKEKPSSSPEAINAPSTKEMISGLRQDAGPSERKAGKGKARVVTVVKDWKTIRKPVINFANLRFFRLSHGGKKTPHKEQVDENLTAEQPAVEAPDSKAPAEADSTSTIVQAEALENDTTDSSAPLQTEEPENTETGTKQQPSRSPTDKESCTTENSADEKSCEQCANQEHSSSDSPSINHEESEKFPTRKPHRGMQIKKKRESPPRESTPTEDSGDESCCTDSSTYYQIVKKPKKKPVKNRKRSLQKKKLEAARTSRKLDVMH